MPTFSVDALPKTSNNRGARVENIDFELRRQVINFNEFFKIKGSNLVATDIIEAIKVYPGETVADVRTIVVTPAGAAMTCTVGDGVTPAGFIATAALNAAAGTSVGSGGAYVFSTTPTGGKTYLAADTIDLVLAGTASNTGVVEVIARIFNPQN
jgi:hypothetical protein